jgi:hypothetical protein
MRATTIWFRIGHSASNRGPPPDPPRPLSLDLQAVTWLEFWAEIVSATAWPLVGLVAVFFLRKEIKSLASGIVGRVGDILRLQFPGGAIDFESKAKAIAENTDKLNRDQGDEVVTIEARQDVALPQETPREKRVSYEELANVDPKAAILVSFADLEGLLRRSFKRIYPAESSKISFGKLVDTLHRDGQIDSTLAESLKTLASMRNEISHGTAAVIDHDTAHYYVDAVTNVLVYLTSTPLYRD